MGESTGIQWATATWNPWQGCRPVSAGCSQCYMIRDMGRFGLDPRAVRRSSRATFGMPLYPRRVPAGSRVFVCSWSDFFLAEADGWRAEAWEIMRLRPDVVFMLLTKRPENIGARLPAGWPWPNVWLGVTAENQEMADRRIPVLLEVPAALRFVSVEPMLEAVDLTWLLEGEEVCDVDLSREVGAKVGCCVEYRPGLDWVIAGAESGGGRRRASSWWFRFLRDQAVGAGVPFFLKQADRPDGRLESMPSLDGQVWGQIPGEVSHG